MAISSSSSSSPAGAGRHFQVIWPGFGDAINAAGAGSTTQLAKGGVTSNITIGSGAAGLGTGTWRNYTIAPVAAESLNSPTLGTPAFRLFSGVVGDAIFIKFNYTFPVEIDALLAGAQPDPMFRVMRFLARIAFVPLAGAVNVESTFGLALIPGNNTSINGGGAKPGIMLGPTDAGIISVRARHDNVAGYRYQADATLAQLGITTYNQWLTYELRVIGASAGNPALLKAFVNNILIGSRGFGSVANGLPSPSAAGGGIQGLVPYVIADNTVGGTLYLRWMSVISTPDEGTDV